MNDPDTPPGLLDLAETAAEHIRELNHRTRGPSAFTGPAQLYRLVGELVLLVEGLPQLLDQLGCWLDAEHHADRVRADNHPNPGTIVTRATPHLSHAGDTARDLAHALDRAQQHLAHLGSQPARLDRPADLPACSTRPQVVPCSWQNGGPITLASDSQVLPPRAAGQDPPAAAARRVARVCQINGGSDLDHAVSWSGSG